MASWLGIRPMVIICCIPGVGEAERSAEKMPPPPGEAGGVCSAARRGRGAGDGERAVRGRWRASEMMSMVPSSQERLRRCGVFAFGGALGPTPLAGLLGLLLAMLTDLLLDDSNCAGPFHFLQSQSHRRKGQTQAKGQRQQRTPTSQRKNDASCSQATTLRSQIETGTRCVKEKIRGDGTFLRLSLTAKRRAYSVKECN